ncbi:MFS transporter [Polaribacter batillariae]|uniref:MFS transporter n=1 Tax=Polaribacter batillariae TaxID=2808900 RepID=A0ABX7SZE4_9FLAO|nr:MFS transporter [Polaribacter batillariae]QTD38203.1 MFS transporter [Polaribacter batillariae]
MNIKKHILPIIVIAQFFCTSLWFAGNGVITDLVSVYQLDTAALGNLTAAVQFGFIVGTLLFALFTITDRFSPSKVFFVCALLGSLFNLGLIWEQNNLNTLLFFRFLTGFFLAGIYPVGMKIATDYYEKGLGKSLSFLVGALVLGTALPHLLKATSSVFLWKPVLYTTSTLAFIGGFLVFLLIPNGPFRKKASKLDISICFKIFKNNKFRQAAFGYFGHMWELYAFWTFVPVFLKIYSNLHKNTDFNSSLIAFFIIGIGSLACVLGGFISEKLGLKRTAFLSLLFSGFCCLLLPFAFMSKNEYFFITFLLFWGMVVIADSPLFSTLVAKNTVSENKGTALTIVNSIGFFMTIISIQLINLLFKNYNSNYIFLFLAIGPIAGIFILKKKYEHKN